ncbi:MAG: hypothetical protein P9L94_11885 [Candidatus Hinthialibacter antarcticus]|nr:hypothetical protein [Candidatus Hinthialibacter antarcticus]
MAKQPITPDMLSRYYDGLLDDDQARRVAQSIESDPEAHQLLETYALFDDALQPDLSDAEIDGLVSDTVQQVHQRLAMPTRRVNASWSWLLAPRFMMAACVVLALVSIVIVPQMQAPVDDGSQRIAEAPADDNPTAELDPIQQQALLATASFAGSAISSGVNAISERSGALAETYKAIETKSEASIALSAIREGITSLRANDEQTQIKTEATEAVNQLEELKRRQAVIGLGASLFSFMSII